MTFPPPPKTPNIWKTLAIVLLAVVIIMGAIVGILSTNLLSTNQGTGTNNQVQVSGTVQEFQIGIIQFQNLNRTIKTSAPIIDGKYSVLLVGGQSYDVTIKGTYNYYSVYVPSGVATFTANF